MGPTASPTGPATAPSPATSRRSPSWSAPRSTRCRRPGREAPGRPAFLTPDSEGPHAMHLLVLIPVKPNLHPLLKERARELAGRLPAANPGHTFEVVFDEGGPGDHG